MTPRLTLASMCLLGAAAQAAGHAHVHGVATLDIAVESQTIVVHFATPLDNLVGFERAPRTDAERQQAGAAVARLEAGAQMMRIDPAANCRLAGVELSSPALKLGQPEAAATQAGHAEIDARYRFDCDDASRAEFIEVGLFDFTRLQRLQVQGATPHGQFKRDLKRPAQRIVLRR